MRLVLAAIAVSAIVGIALFLVGWLKQGGLIRFIPYAVLHGFLAGVGLFLVFFALSLATGATVTISHLGPLWGEGALLRWGPAVASGVALFFITTRWKNPLLLPGILVATVVLFLAAMQLTGIDSATAMARRPVRKARTTVCRRMRISTGRLSGARNACFGGKSDTSVEALEQMEARDRALIRTLVADMKPFCERVEYPLGHVLWYAGDPSPDMHYVKSGELQLFTVDRSRPSSSR